ncbi:3'-5' exonuclease [Robertkochia flava]|uniref:3'-5' exonuclease n=1 Tax=Robertkochia flava TaxID=3447986 RepID=UPI001CCB7FA1|nr:3'-5' exonuclease [Robertkochia marina]
MKWFTKKSTDDAPGFWKAYLETFREPLPEFAHQTTYVAFDTETTGFDFNQDRILALGAVKILDNQIRLDDTLEIYTTQDHFNPDTVPIHGILHNPRHQTISELEMLKQFLDYIGNAPLIAHHANFDIGMINQALKRHGLPPLKNKVVDTMKFYRRGLITSNLVDKQRSYSLDEVAEKLNVPLKDRHTAAGDAFITALIFMKLWRRWEKKKSLKTKTLIRVQ